MLSHGRACYAIAARLFHISVAGHRRSRAPSGEFPRNSLAKLSNFAISENFKHFTILAIPECFAIEIRAKSSSFNSRQIHSTICFYWIFCCTPQNRRLYRSQAASQRHRQQANSFQISRRDRCPRPPVIPVPSSKTPPTHPAFAAPTHRQASMRAKPKPFGLW